MPIARRFLVSTLVISLFAAAAFAQEGADAEPAAEEAPPPDFVALAMAPDVSKTALDIYVTPLDKEQLESLLAHWKGLLKGTAEKIAALEAKMLTADSAGKAAISKELTALRADQGALVERLKVVMDAFEAKGGDTEQVKKYIEAATDTKLNLSDAEGLWNLAKEWIVSPGGGIKTGMNIVFFLLTLIAFRILARILAGITRKAVSTMKRTSDLLRQFFVNTVRNITFLIGIVVALSMIGIDVGPFVAAIGAVGFIIAFALQGTLSNFAAGIMILLYRPYDVGQVVTVSGVTGKVNAMSLVSTTLLTPDNQIVTVPNGSIWGGIITNITGNPTRRVDLVFGISYGDDIAKAKAILEEVVGANELVLADPAPVIEVDQLADSSVNFVVRPWAKTGDYWTVKWALTRAVKERFDAEGISIPFPQRDVHVHAVGATPASGNGGGEVVGATRAGA